MKKMLERVFLWQAPSRKGMNDRLTVIEYEIIGDQTIKTTRVTWSRDLEAVVSAIDGASAEAEPLHMTSGTQLSLDRGWLAFCDLSKAHSADHPLATMLDYARFYGLRTMGCLATLDDCSTTLRPETFALDLVIVDSSEKAVQLSKIWRAQNLDVKRAPLISVLPTSDQQKCSSSGRIGDILRSTPLLRRVIVLDGSLGTSTGLAQAIAMTGTEVQCLRWSSTAEAILPVIQDTEYATSRLGSLFGNWAVLSLESCRNDAEAMEIVDQARGLGLKIAIVVGSTKLDLRWGRCVLEGADLVLFSSDDQREVALRDAFVFDERIATLRYRWRVTNTAAAILYEIYARRSKINCSGRLQRPAKIYYLTRAGTNASINPDHGEVEGYLTTSLYDLGIQVIPLQLETGVSFCASQLSNAQQVLEPDRTLSVTNAPPPTSLAKEWLLIPESITTHQAISRIVHSAKLSGMNVAAIFPVTVKGRTQKLP